MFAIFPGESAEKPLRPRHRPLTLVLDVFTGIYGFSIGTGGLAYIGLGVGFVVATLFGAWVSDGIYASVRPSSFDLLFPISEPFFVTS